MKARQKTRTMAKPSCLTFKGTPSLILVRHSVAKPVNNQGLISTPAHSEATEKEQVAINLEAERKRALARAYSNMIPPR